MVAKCLPCLLCCSARPLAKLFTNALSGAQGRSEVGHWTVLYCIYVMYVLYIQFLYLTKISNHMKMSKKILWPSKMRQNFSHQTFFTEHFEYRRNEKSWVFAVSVCDEYIQIFKYLHNSSQVTNLLAQVVQHCFIWLVGVYQTIQLTAWERLDKVG